MNLITKTVITNLGIPAQDTTYVFDGTYNASTNKAATVNTVTNAINALDGNLNNTTPGAGKTLTAFSQTDGKISADFQDIAIVKAQVTDFPEAMPPTTGTKVQRTGVISSLWQWQISWSVFPIETPTISSSFMVRNSS